mgnify:CR=1 FL=1
MAGRAYVHVKGSFSLSDLLESVRNNPSFHKAGALAIFVGVVRGETPRGERVQRLQLEAYDEKANEVLEKICEDLEKRRGVVDVQVHHLTGDFEVGEEMVYVSVAGAHRRDVFSVLEEAVERYKREAPIFKKEYIIDEKGESRSRWVSERGA